MSKKEGGKKNVTGNERGQGITQGDQVILLVARRPPLRCQETSF